MTPYRESRMLCLCVALVLSAAPQVYAQNRAADPTGTWTWATPGQKRSLSRTTTLRLRVEEDKLTGTIYTPQSQRGTNDVPITDAKLVGDKISFTVVRELDRRKCVQKFSGKVSRDTIRGNVEFELDGKPQSRDWVAKR